MRQKCEIDALDEANEEDIESWRPHLRSLLGHDDELVRVSTLELIQRHQVRGLIDAMTARVNDDSFMVRSYALSAIYTVDAGGAIVLLEKATHDPDLYVRITAWVLLFVDTRDYAYIDRISAIVLDAECHYHLPIIAVSLLSSYLEVRENPRLLALAQEIAKVHERSRAVTSTVDNVIAGRQHKEN